MVWSSLTAGLCVAHVVDSVTNILSTNPVTMVPLSLSHLGPAANQG